MAIVTVENLLGRAEKFERRLEEFYADLRDHSDDNGVRLLTYYLARHRRHVDKALAMLDPEDRERAGKVQLRFEVEFSPEETFDLLGVPADKVRGPDLLEVAIRYDEALVRFYRQMLGQQLPKETHELIESLIRIEEKDIVMLRKMLAMNYF